MKELFSSFSFLCADAVRSGFDEASEKGTAEIFSAPLPVIKAYVKELTSYGLAARAKEAETEIESKYTRRDFKDRLNSYYFILIHILIHISFMFLTPWVAW